VSTCGRIVPSQFVSSLTYVLSHCRIGFRRLRGLLVALRPPPRIASDLQQKLLFPVLALNDGDRVAPSWPELVPRKRHITQSG
jgi:hypothetical protein